MGCPKGGKQTGKVTKAKSRKCHNTVSFDKAQEICAATPGQRLCTLDEVKQCAICSRECNTNNVRVWTSTPELDQIHPGMRITGLTSIALYRNGDDKSSTSRWHFRAFKQEKTLGGNGTPQ